LRDAANLWGKGTFEVEKHFKEKYGEEYQIALIGPGVKTLLALPVSITIMADRLGVVVSAL
jgi:aldehyde:ferredoxin oxidoreductase